MGSDSGNYDDYESLATLLAGASAAFAKHETHTNCTLSSNTKTAAVCDMSLLMHEIDGSEGEDNPSRVNTRVFPRSTYKASSASMLRCSGPANSYQYVVERSPLLIISRELCPKTN